MDCRGERWISRSNFGVICGVIQDSGEFWYFRGKVTIWCIFIDKYLGGVRSAVALILIIGLEVWRCVLFAGLFVWAVEAG